MFLLAVMNFDHLCPSPQTHTHTHKRNKQVAWCPSRNDVIATVHSSDRRKVCLWDLREGRSVSYMNKVSRRFRGYKVVGASRPRLNGNDTKHDDKCRIGGSAAVVAREAGLPQESSTFHKNLKCRSVRRDTETVLAERVDCEKCISAGLVLACLGRAGPSNAITCACVTLAWLLAFGLLGLRPTTLQHH